MISAGAVTTNATHAQILTPHRGILMPDGLIVESMGVVLAQRERFEAKWRYAWAAE